MVSSSKKKINIRLALLFQLGQALVQTMIERLEQRTVFDLDEGASHRLEYQQPVGQQLVGQANQIGTPFGRIAVHVLTALLDQYGQRNGLLLFDHEQRLYCANKLRQSLYLAYLFVNLRLIAAACHLLASDLFAVGRRFFSDLCFKG